MKQNLLLLHGALGSKAQFEPLKTKLSTNFNVFTFNFEGHGGRTTEKDYTNAVFTENVLAFMAANNISKTHLFGYSMGGYVALDLLIKHSEKVGKLMTLATKFNWTPEVAAKEIKMLNAEKIAEKVPKFAAALEKRHAPDDWKVVLQKTAEMMSRLGNGAALDESKLEKITNQILVGIGTKDRMVNLEESERLANLLPNSQLMVIDGFKHPIEAVDVDKLTAILIDFL